jgi:hypothetical protein
MLKDITRHTLIKRGLLAALICSGAALVPAFAQQNAKTPDFSGNGTGWDSKGGMTPVAGSPSPVTQDPKVRYVPNNVGEQPTWRYADLNNPNLTEAAKKGLREANALHDKGFAMYNRTSRCWMPGIPVLNLSPGRTYFIQTPNVVYIMWQRDQIVRRIPLTRERTGSPRKSWHGDSIGWYEGDTLVVDTIGQDPRTFVDLFRTPVSDKLHVVERFRLVDGGKEMEVEFTVDDPVMFVKPWKATKRWSMTPAKPYGGDTTATYNDEIRCMDGESVNPFNQTQAAVVEPLPVATKADF